MTTGRTYTLESAEKCAMELQAMIAKGLRDMLLALPDNPRINRINKKCFTIQFSDLGPKWSVAYHDFKAQYRLLAEWLQRIKAPSLVKALRARLESGYVPLTPIAGRPSDWKQPLHPDVIAHVRAMLNTGTITDEGAS
jgi:hypothetical protein